MYPIDWLNGFDSASFSVARCSRPMCGSAFWMTSPSISSTRRSTPCAAGCCGPKFMVKLRISATGFPHRRIGQRGIVAIVVTDDLGHQDPRFDADRLVHHTPLLRIVAHLHIAGEREVLAERMADEAVIGEQAAQVRVTLEQNAEHVEGLALEPIDAGPHTGHRIHHGL